MDYHAIAKTIRKERCDKHIIKATVIVKTDSIELLCCCDKFKEKLLKKIEREKKKQNKKAIKEVNLQIAYQ